MKGWWSAVRGAGGWGEAGKGREICKARDKVSTTASRTERGRREQEHTPGVILVAARAWRGEGEQGGGGRVEAGPSDDDHATARGANSSSLETVPVHLSTNRPSPAHLSISGISSSPWRRRPLPPSPAATKTYHITPPPSRRASHPVPRRRPRRPALALSPSDAPGPRRVLSGRLCCAGITRRLCWDPTSPPLLIPSFESEHAIPADALTSLPSLQSLPSLISTQIVSPFSPSPTLLPPLLLSRKQPPPRPPPSRHPIILLRIPSPFGNLRPRQPF